MANLGDVSNILLPNGDTASFKDAAMRTEVTTARGNFNSLDARLDDFDDTIGDIDEALSDIFVKLVPKTITQNGTYDPEDDNADGYNEVTVDVLTGGQEVTVTTLADAVVTLEKTGTTYTATADSNGIATFIGVTAGTYTVTVVYDDATSDSTTITVTDFSVTENTFATLTISASDNCTITVTDGTTTKTLSYTGTPIVQYVSLGTWTVSATIDSTLITRTVSVSSYNNQSVYLATINSVTRQVNFETYITSITDGSIENVTTFSGMRRCNVADDGTINAFYGDSGYTEDGTNGQVMVYIPKFYYKVNHTNSSGTALSNGAAIDIGNWSIADGPLTGYSVHPAFINASGNEVDYFLIGAFEAVFQNGSSYTSLFNSSYKMASSKGDGSLRPATVFSRANGRTTATARGIGWYQCGIKQISAVQMLMIVEYGCNSQTAIGQGYTSTGNKASTYVGQTTGNGTSDHSGGTSSVVYRGIENLWGNVIKWIDGLNMIATDPYVYTGYSFTDSTSTGTRLAFSVSSASFITRFGYDTTFDWIFLPISADSSGNSMIGDRLYASTSYVTYSASLGGLYYYDSAAGFFCWHLSESASSTLSYIGSRIMYVPT